MSTIKTKKGTELPLLNLKGKQYLQVAHRLVWMREEHPDWSLETEFARLDETHALAKATIRDQGGRVIAVAHKREDKAHFPDFIEKSETGAIGRALALCGFGTQFAEELEDGATQARPVDSPTTTKKGPAPKVAAPVKPANAFANFGGGDGKF
jgi:hypothetical protein